MKGINCSCFKLEEKAIKSVKTSIDTFMNVIGDKFATRLRWGKSTISSSVITS